jgi:hypothetical protein
MKKKKIFNKRNIQSELYNCRFDPNIDGPMKIIIDINNATYWENRAIELIKMAQIGGEHIDYQATITKAIQLLIMAKIMRKVVPDVQEPV